MSVKTDGSDYGMPLKRVGRRGRVTQTVTVPGEGNDGGRKTSTESGISRVALEDVPVEIRADDSASYVRLLTDVAWVNELSEEIARHYPPGKVVWSLDRKRLSVVAEMQREAASEEARCSPDADELPRDSVLEIESSSSAREDSESTREGSTREVLYLGPAGDGISTAPSESRTGTMDWHPEHANPSVAPPIDLRTRYTPAPPPQTTSTIQGIRKNAGYYSAITSEIPTALSSVPPPVKRQRQRVIPSWVKMASLVAVFAMAVLIMLSTPFPAHDTGETDNGMDRVGAPIKGAVELASPVPTAALSDPGHPVHSLIDETTGEVTMFFTIEEVEAAIASGLVPVYG
jgi:hypothetical protein